MNSKEIILANLNHSKYSRVGMTFDRGRINDILMISPKSPVDYKQSKWVEGDIEYYDDEWGNIWRRKLTGCVKGEIHEHLLKDWKDLHNLKIPNYSNPSQYEYMKKKFAETNDKFKMALIGGWIFDNSRYLRRLEIYLMDMIEYPGELKELHNIVASVYEEKIKGAAKAGADGILIGEDMGTQSGLLFSPDLWRFYFQKLYKKLFGLAHDLGLKIFMHSCGKNDDILDNLIDAGVDCFQFDQPLIYDTNFLSTKFKIHKIGLWSPVDIQKVLPTGNRAFIEQKTEEMINQFKGGLIMTTYGDLPGVGIKEEWDMWAYEKLCKMMNILS